jgi:putative transcriptional regulator
MSRLGDEIIEGLQGALEYSRGNTEGCRVHRVRIPERVDVRDVRDRLEMTQQEFADRFGFSVYSVRNWEQGRRQPEGPARILLTIIDREPEAALRALSK